MPLEELFLQKLATHVREGGNEGVAPPPWVPFSEVRDFKHRRLYVCSFRSLRGKFLIQKKREVSLVERLQVADRPNKEILVKDLQLLCHTVYT